MQDDSVREIQLNGKQVVFLFMTATAAAVVIFLCGVMVGRGVSAPPELSAISTTPLDPTAEVIYGEAGVPDALVSQSPAERLASFEEPPIEADAEPLEPGPVAPVVHEPVPAPVAVPRSSERPRTEPRGPDRQRAEAAEPVPVPAAPPPSAARPGDAFVVQVTAVRARSQADSIAAELTSKGFPAFVTSPETGAPFFRVRVGPYQDGGEAKRVAARLEAEEQLSPWITH